MKRIIFSLAFMAAATTMFAQAGTLKMKGELKNLGDSIVVLVGSKQIPVTLKDGKFDVTVQLDKPTNLVLTTPATLRREDRKVVPLVGVPGEEAEFSSGNEGTYYVTGSKFYKEFNEIDKAMEALQAPVNELAKSMQERMKAGEDRQKIVQEFQEKVKPLMDAKRAGVLSIVKAHPDYEYCALLVNEMEGSKQMDELLGLLSPKVRNGRMKALYTEVVDAEKQKEAQQKAAEKVQGTGAVAPDFTLEDIHGKQLSLSSLKGKYVIIDFWGSWCVWCIKGFPEMKNYYNKYSGKLEILGVDCGDTPEKWKAAVKQHDLPWLHVINGKDDKDVAKLYMVRGFPTKVIVDPEGKVVKTIVGEDPEFYTLLDKLFAESK